MPIPHGSRGGMAFSADELRVLRRALADIAQPALVPDHEVRACTHLARAVDEASAEAARERDFRRADLERYRAALPGSATGFLDHLREALTAGSVPTAADLRALRRLATAPDGRNADRTAAERVLARVRAAHPALVRRALLVLPGGLPGALPHPGPQQDALPTAALADLVGIARRMDADDEHGEAPPDQDTPARDHPEHDDTGHDDPTPGDTGHDDTDKDGGERMAAKDGDDDRKRTPRPAPERPRPATPGPAGPRPSRPVPTPGEVFPPRRRPKPSSDGRAPAALPA